MKCVWSLLYIAFIAGACNQQQTKKSTVENDRCMVETDSWVYQYCSDYFVTSDEGMSESLWFSCKGLGKIKATKVVDFNCK
jgi:hypothetical protein